MFPAFVVPDEANSTKVNTKHRTYFALRLTAALQRTNAAYLVIGQFCNALTFAAWYALRMRARAVPVSVRAAFGMRICPVPITRRHSSLLGCVDHVVLASTKKQMRLGYARGIVAAWTIMAHHQRTRLFTIVQEIRDTVSAVVAGAPVSANAEMSIAPVANSGSPQLASVRVRWCNLRSKASDFFRSQIGNVKMRVSHFISFVDGLVRAAFGVQAPTRLAYCNTQNP